jgi:hypothetical protein
MRKAWMRAVLSGEQPDNIIDDASVDALLQSADFEGVLPLLEWRLRGSPMWPQLPAALRDGLTTRAREVAAQSLFREGELRKVAKVIERSGIKTLLLKGNALSQWLYPKPYLRVSGDIDLLQESRAAVERAAAAFTDLGYALQFSPADSNYEMTSRLIVDGINRSELDLHSRLLNSAAYAEIFSFDELWGAAMPLATIGAGLKALSPMHALAHACLNRALDMQNGVPDRLKLLYDIHLLLERMDADAWQQFLAMAAAKRISGIALRSIADTAAAFHSSVPSEAMDALHRQAAEEPIDWRRLHDWRYMQWQNLKALPGTTARLRWLWERVFPTHSHLRELHGEGAWPTLMLRRLGRGLLRLRNRA